MLHAPTPIFTHTGHSQMLQDMKASQVQRNAWVYSSMVAALVRRGDVQGAQAMVEAMREDGVKPTTVVFNTLLQAYADSEAPVARVRRMGTIDHCSGC